jgi:hypothetical protein
MASNSSSESVMSPNANARQLFQVDVGPGAEKQVAALGRHGLAAVAETELGGLCRFAEQ